MRNRFRTACPRGFGLGLGAALVASFSLGALAADDGWVYATVKLKPGESGSVSLTCPDASMKTTRYAVTSNKYDDDAIERRVERLETSGWKITVKAPGRGGNPQASAGRIEVSIFCAKA